MTTSEEMYLIVYAGKDKFAINTCSIESIHSSASINFNEDLSRCLPESCSDWDKSIPIISLKGSSDNEGGSSFVKHLSRVIFLSDNQGGRSAALIVNKIIKVANVSTEIEGLNELTKADVIELIKIDNEEVEIFDIRNVFMT